jgi:hypothetical protein
MDDRPLWFRTVYSVWFPSVMLGLVAYFTLSLVNDFTDTGIPLWGRLLSGLLVTLMVRVLLRRIYGR